MPWKIKLITKLYTALILALLCLNARGAVEPYQQQLKGRIRNGDTLLLRDEKFENAAYDWSLIVNRKVSNHITFGLLMDSVNRIHKPFTAELDMKVEYWSQPGQADPVTEDHIRLTLKYDTAHGVLIKPQDVYRFLNGHRVKITVNSITSPELGEDLPGIFELTSQVFVDRKYRPDPNAPAGKIFVTPTSGQQGGEGGSMQLFRMPIEQTANKVVLNWNKIDNSEEYDLEWTFVDETSENGTLLANETNWTDANLAKIFRNNATRVTLSQHSYTINLVHYSKYLIVRLRGVTTNAEQIRVEKNWLYDIEFTEEGQSPVTQKGVIELENGWHHPDLSWQYNATYAEEGKRKEVVTYFDKSLKGRQVVTLTNNSNDPVSEDKVNVVAQSTIYDQYGRAAVNVLPAPIVANVLNYYPGLDKKADGSAYTFMDVNPGGRLCDFTFPQMGSTSGAGKYYSADNPFQSEAFHKFVPDAEGYPFSGQFYTNDNTGRITVQGGVGKVFQPNADPSFTGTHATRYYYSKPTQRELYRMFGNDVGDASHYSKTTTIDPNGQISVSYANLSGKTIATALSGPAPDNVDELEGASSARSEKKFTLFNGTAFTFDPSKLTLSASQVYIAQETGSAKFDIDVPRILAQYAETGICTECAYEGVLSISSDCMDDDLNEPITITGGGPSVNCLALNPAMFQKPVNATFSRKGAYYITLELRLKENVIKQAAEQYVTLNTSLKKQFEFVIGQLRATDFGGCFDDCKTCYTALGVKANFIQRIKERLTSLNVNVTANTAAIDGWAGPLYDQLSAACTASRANCSDNPCQMLRNQMLTDVSPYGQYALFDQNGLPQERDINVLYQNWRTVFPKKAPDESGYSANIVQMEDGQQLSVHDASFTLQDLVAHWNPDWAVKFIEFHPEYCGLEVCERNSAYLKWDDRVKSFAVTAADIPVILPGKQYDRNVPAWLVSADPYFATGAHGEDYKTAFIADLQNYSGNVKKIAGRDNKSVTQFVDFMLYCAMPGGSANSTPSDDNWNCTPDADCRIADREWQLYLQSYMELKQYYYQKDREENECGNKCKVGETISLSGCPSVGAFSLSGGTVSGTSRELIVRHEGGPLPKATVVTLFYPNEYNGLTQVETVSFAAGESHRTVSIHSGIPVDMIGVKNVTCTPGTSTYVCNGTSYVLELGSSGRKAGRYTWENVTTAGYLKTYYAKEGYADETPATPAGCANAQKTFYNCLRIKYADNGEGEYLQNVWLITCDATVCASSQNYTANTLYSQNRFSITGAEIEIFQFTEPDNNLTSTRCTGYTKAWYSCVTVTYNGTVYTYRNATVFTCPDGGGGACAGGYIPIYVEGGGGTEFYGYGKRYYVFYDPGYEPPCVEGVEQIPQPACVKFIGPFGELDFETVYVATCNNFGGALRGAGEMSTMSVPDPGFDQSVTFSCAGMGHIAYQKFTGSGGRVYWKAGYTGADILPGGYVSAVFVVGYVKNGLPVVQSFPVTFNTSNMTLIQEFGVNVAASEVSSVALVVARPDCYAGGTVSGCPEAYKSKQSRLVRVDYNNMPVSDLEAIGQGQMQAIIQSACANQAESWLRQIDECLKAYPDKREQLKIKLIELCNKGVDIKHPNGASTLPPGASVPGGAVSFKDVIVQVLGAGSLSMECNPWMIDAPYPYKAPVQTNSLLISSTDESICAKLTTLQNDYTTANPGVSFPQYLRNRFGAAMTLTDAQVTDLVNSCGNCKYLLNANIELPVFLAANAKGCITASELNTAYADLLAEGISGFSNTHRNYERIVSNYFNHRWGFTLGYPAYKKLLDAYATHPDQLLCNEPLFNSRPEDPYDCLLAQVNHATRNGMMEYDKYIAEEKRKFRQDYIAKCGQAKPVLKLTAMEGDYHYTLYYYDQAGELVKTVPPAGVHLLTDAQIEAAEAAAAGIPVCNYVGPVEETPIGTTNSYVNTALASGSRSIEMWLYQPSLPHGQLLFTTGVNGYLFNACMGGEFMELDIYKLMPATPSSGVAMSGSRHFKVKYVKPAELTWLHLVVQGADLGSGTGNLEIFVNGAQATAVPAGEIPTTCGWQVSFENGSLVLPSNTAALKHIRGYSRSLTQDEITAQYGEACLGVSQLLASTPRDHWGRHNIPSPGGPTTVGGGTNETRNLPFYPTHWLSSTYSFTSLGGVYSQHTPDANESRFWYDRLGRLVASRNAVQTDRTSYTKYDEQGRIKEVGERPAGGGWAGAFLDGGQVKVYLNEALSSRKYITTTLYDKPYNDEYTDEPILFAQSNLRKRVSASFLQETPSSEKVITAYSYDMLGNAQTVYQYINWQLGLKRIDYKYDLASGKVNALRYKTGDGNNDFFYNYKYDAENRLVKAQSGIDADDGDWMLLTPVTDGEYYYYRHGPLARMELGGNKVQGLDYAYTLQGWLKAINGQLLDDDPAPVGTSLDMGGDGFPLSGVNATVGKDAYAFTLDYYHEDYKAVVDNVFRYTNGYGSGSVPTKQLFNGNIARSTLTLPFLPAGQINPMVGHTYRYDQLNRLKNMTHYADLMGSPETESPLYAESIEYDPNGNIKKYKRYGNLPGGNALMDDLTYRYQYDPQGYLAHNQLTSIDDAMEDVTRYTTDIDDQEANNYVYDAIGNLTKDRAEKINKINWTVYGKIASIEKENGQISYRYDAAGNRVYKESTIGGGSRKTWYVRDAQGNTLAVYSDNGNGSITWDEQHLYGSSRLGYWRLGLPKGSTLTDAWDDEGRKSYELTNHLGNVLAVVSDKAPDVQKRPEILQLQDYYAFGMGMPGRSDIFEGSSYRYGFNGKENDNEIKGEGNQQDYGFRIYDPRIGKFLSVDPLTAQYPELTPYQFASNRPIDGIDLDGLEHSSAGKESGRDNVAVMKLPMAADIMVKSVGEARTAAMQQKRIDDATAEAQQMHEATQKAEASVGAKKPFLGTVYARVMFDLAKEQMFRDAGSNPDGSKSLLQKLSRDKTWKNLNENIIEPMGEMAVAEGAGSLVIKGTGILISEFAVSSAATTAKAVGRGFKSFSAFKREMGPAGPGQAWHHIVEQTPGNVARFGNEAIHNTNNLIKLPHGAGSLHAKISGHYSSKQFFTGGQTVRQWLSTQSYQAQYDYGIKMLKQFSGTP